MSRSTQDLLRDAADDLRELSTGYAKTRRDCLDSVNPSEQALLVEALAAAQLQAANTVAAAILDGLAAVAGKLD